MKKKERKRKDVKRTHVFLEKTDPDWIEKKGWFEALENFELGENFFSSVLLKSVNGKKELSFYCSIRTIKEENNQKVVDYLWWNNVFLKGKMQDLFSPEELKLLKKKKKILQKEIKNIFWKNIPLFFKGIFLGKQFSNKKQ